MKTLQDFLPRGSAKNNHLSVPNAPQFLKDCASTCLENREFSKAILMSTIESSINMFKSNSNKVKIEPVVLDFFRLV